MAVLLCIFSLMMTGQEPTKKQKKQQPVKIIVDTTVISERAADTIFMKQSIALNELDSLIQEKQKK